MNPLGEKINCFTKKEYIQYFISFGRQLSPFLRPKTRWDGEAQSNGKISKYIIDVLPAVLRLADFFKTTHFNTRIYSFEGGTTESAISMGIYIIYLFRFDLIEICEKLDSMKKICNREPLPAVAMDVIYNHYAVKLFEDQRYYENLRLNQFLSYIDSFLRAANSKGAIKIQNNIFTYDFEDATRFDDY